MSFWDYIPKLEVAQHTAPTATTDTQSNISKAIEHICKNCKTHLNKTTVPHSTRNLDIHKFNCSTCTYKTSRFASKQNK